MRACTKTDGGVPYPTFAQSCFVPYRKVHLAVYRTDAQASINPSVSTCVLLNMTSRLASMLASFHGVLRPLLRLWSPLIRRQRPHELRLCIISGVESILWQIARGWGCSDGTLHEVLEGPLVASTVKVLSATSQTISEVATSPPTSRRASTLACMSTRMNITLTSQN